MLFSPESEPITCTNPTCPRAGTLVSPDRRHTLTCSDECLRKVRQCANARLVRHRIGRRTLLRGIGALVIHHTAHDAVASSVLPLWRGRYNITCREDAERERFRLMQLLVSRETPFHHASRTVRREAAMLYYSLGEIANDTVRERLQAQCMDLLRDAGVTGDGEHALAKALHRCFMSQAYWRKQEHYLHLATALIVEGNLHRIMADRAAKHLRARPPACGVWSPVWDEQCRLALRAYEDARYLLTAKCRQYAWREVSYYLASALRWQLRLEYAYLGKDRRTLHDARTHMQAVAAASQSPVSLLEASRESGAFYTPAPPVYEGNDALAEEGFADAEAYAQRIPAPLQTPSLFASLRGAQIPFFQTIGKRTQAVHLLLHDPQSYRALTQAHALSRNFYRFLELCDALHQPYPDWVTAYADGPKTPVVSTGILPHDLMHELWQQTV